MLRQIIVARQASINAICSYLALNRIRSTYDLSAKIEEIVSNINQDPKIFTPSDSIYLRAEIFTAAIADYSRITEYAIHLPNNFNTNLFNVKQSKNDSINSNVQLSSPKTAIKSKYEIDERAITDLSRVTHSYDQVVDAVQKNKKINQDIIKVLKEKDYGVCDSIIFGAGDTGTTLWLEKYKSQHLTAHQSLAKEKLPEVLIVADGFGSWKHDYTLAQTHSSLERATAYKNPCDFLSTGFYQENPQVNARHVFQANQVCLGRTEAPLLNLKVLAIQKKENHSAWQSDSHPYRLIVQFPNNETKDIYTTNIEICTGLGAPNLTFNGDVIDPPVLEKLNRYNSQLGFTPIVDGNQFALTNSEERANGRTILIYGGGGTASACYRKSFFGNDIRTYNRPYTSDYQKNEVIWVYRDFIGTGKMATTALEAAKTRKEMFKGELIRITPTKEGRLFLTFKMSTPGVDSRQDFVCDQLVYSIGQNHVNAKQVCNEIDSQLQYSYDKSGMLLHLSTSDNKIKFYGTAAVTFRRIGFNKLTTKWLNEQNIGSDVGPGSMPPTRAQIKRYLHSDCGIKPEDINVNIDTSDLIEEFLLDAKVDKLIASSFITDLLLARKDNTYGCSRSTLEQLLKKYQLDEVFDIFGHAHLVLKGKPVVAESMFSSSFSLFDSGKNNKSCVNNHIDAQLLKHKDHDLAIIRRT